ncbi:MAG: outer membrane lipoprotein-sorting protein [Bdellovibrionota bacterium]
MIARGESTTRGSVLVTAVLAGVLMTLLSVPAFAQKGANSKALLQKAEDHMRGKSFQARVKMEVVRDDDVRTMEIRLATRGADRALIKILKPNKDKNAGNLRIDLNLWQFLPNVDRLIRVPSSMMLQSWMGSDLTNDDLVKVSSLARDYDSKIEKTENFEGNEAYKIICSPKPTAPVTWGKVIAWVRKPDGVPLKREFYSEKGELIKVFSGTDIKSFSGGHTMPTKWVMKNAKKPGALTRLEYTDIVFDKSIPESTFTQQNLRKPISE